MGEFEHTSRIAASPEAVYAWHTRPGGFERLTPPWEDLRVVARTGGVEEGSRWDLRMRVGPIPMTWIAIHQGCVPGREFTDRQVKGPFRQWEHRHRFEPDGDGCIMTDSIRYQLPMGDLGRLFGERYVRRQLARTFRWRHARVAHNVGRHESAALAPMRIAVSGASGLVGTALCAFLTAGGHTVQRLVRRSPTGDDIAWDPARGTIDTGRLAGVDAVVHLAGAPVAGGRWTDDRKALILNSRVDGTGLLARTLAQLPKPPRVLVSASAVGFYGHSDEPVTEAAANGEGFLAEVCRRWESATAPAENASIRVVHARIGVALSRRSGALKEMLLPFSAGLGAVAGPGTVDLRWVALDDVVGGLHHAIACADVRGPVNLTAPAPLTHRHFAKTLGRVLRRPVFMPLPRFAVKLLFGQLGEETLLMGAPVVPEVLQATGYRFLHVGAEAALRDELGR